MAKFEIRNDAFFLNGAPFRIISALFIISEFPANIGRIA